MEIKKLKQGEPLGELLKIEPKTQECTDKIEIISLIHGTGQATLYTKTGNTQINIRLDDLIRELKSERDEKIIQCGYFLFENILFIRYPKKDMKRRSEFEKIWKETGIFYTNIYEKNGCMEARIEVNALEIPEILQEVV